MVDVDCIYQIDAVDPDGDPLTYEFNRSPSGMNVDTNGLVTWTPTTNGVFTVQIVVRDGRDGVVGQGYSVSVIPYTNLPPEITSTPIVATDPDVLYTYDVEATDFNRDPLTYDLLLSPSGMVIDGESGLIEWTPSTNDLGAYRIEIEVTDGQGACVQQSYTLVALFDAADAPRVDPDPFTAIALDDFVIDPNHLDSEITWTVSGTNALGVHIDPAAWRLSIIRPARNSWKRLPLSPPTQRDSPASRLRVSSHVASINHLSPRSPTSPPRNHLDRRGTFRVARRGGRSRSV